MLAAAPSAGATTAPGAPDAAAAGADALQSQLMASIMRVRDFGEQVKQFGAENPLVVEEVQQIQQLLKQMLVKIATPVQPQTGSSLGVPTGGMG